MDIYSSVRAYFSKMLSVPPPGMHVLILDDETLGILSVTMSFSEIMEKDVFLVERIKSERESLKHLTGIFFLRPSAENVSLLSLELKVPKYATYYLFFSHALSKHALKQLAETDSQEVVAEVHECYADFFALSPHLFSIDRPLCCSSNFDVKPDVLARSAHAITAILLTLQCLPQIRYQNSSDGCRSLAELVRSFISRETVLFDFRKPERSPVLLIVDRRQDPITPLLTQWTYEAMIHELIGIKNNRIELASSTTASESIQELTISREFDEFYRTNQFLNFGEIGQSIKDLVSNFQKVTKKVDAENAKSISDLKGLLENYPAFRKASGTVEMHVTIVSELSRIVKERSLLEVSEVEQELVCQNSHSTVYPRIRSMIADDRIKNVDVLRLTVIYALRYASNYREIAALSSALISRGIPKEEVSVVERAVDYAASQRRPGPSSDIFSNVKEAGAATVSVSNATSAVASITKRFVKARKNVDNVYTQHEPPVIDFIRDLSHGILHESVFPILECGSVSPRPFPARDIIVFVLGGSTYEESFSVHKLMASTPGLNILLGGSTVHNSVSFLKEVRSTSYDDASSSLDEVKTLPQHTRFPTTLSFPKFHKTPAQKVTRYSLLQ